MQDSWFEGDEMARRKNGALALARVRLDWLEGYAVAVVVGFLLWKGDEWRVTMMGPYTRGLLALGACVLNWVCSHAAGMWFGGIEEGEHVGGCLFFDC